MKLNKWKLIAAFSLMIIIMACANSFASKAYEEKRSETVYINLNAYGEKIGGTMYVDTILNGSKTLTDFGRFKSVENMTNKLKPIYDDKGNLVWDLTKYNGESFAYNVTLEDDSFDNAPWDIDITYKLNGKEIDPKKVAHGVGLVEVDVNVKPNKKAHTFFKNNYMMEVTCDFNMDEYVSVTSKEAIEMMTGKTKTLMWVVAPGSEYDFSIMLGTEDFSFRGITFAMLPIGGELGDIIKELAEDRKDLEDAYTSSVEATGIVLESLSTMTDGLNEAASGLSKLKTGTIKMHDLKGERDVAVEELDKEISSLTKDFNYLSDDIDDLRDEVEVLNDTLENINKYSRNLVSDLDDLDDNLDDAEKITSQIPNMMKHARAVTKDAQALLNCLVHGDDITDKQEAIEESMTEMTPFVRDLARLAQTPDFQISNPAEAAKYGEFAQNFYSLADSLTALSTNMTNLPDITNPEEIAKLADIEKDLTNVIADLKLLEDNGKVFDDTIETSEELVKDIKSLTSEAQKYLNRLVKKREDVDDALADIEKLFDNLAKMSKTASTGISTVKKQLEILSTDLYEGAIGTADGLTDVTYKIADATKQTGSFLSAKDKIDKVVRSNWDELDDKTTIFLMDPDATKVSFVSNKNTEPEKVQIFLKSPEIKEIINDDNALFVKAEAKQGWFKRFLGLFVKLWEKFIGIFH